MIEWRENLKSIWGIGCTIPNESPSKDGIFYEVQSIEKCESLCYESYTCRSFVWYEKLKKCVLNEFERIVFDETSDFGKQKLQDSSVRVQDKNSFQHIMCGFKSKKNEIMLINYKIKNHFYCRKASFDIH